MSSNVSITIASDTERDGLFAELWRGDEQWAEILPDPSTGSFTIEIFAPKDAASYVFDLETLQQSIEDAKAKLAQLGYSRRSNDARDLDCGFQRRQSDSGVKCV